jgi:hypothetical protein
MCETENQLQKEAIIEIRRCPRCDEVWRPGDKDDMYFDVSPQDEATLDHLRNSKFFKERGLKVVNKIVFCAPCHRLVGGMSVKKFLEISGKARNPKYEEEKS